MYERKTPEPPTCPHNPGVVCRVQVFCEKCNWNSEVEKKREKSPVVIQYNERN